MPDHPVAQRRRARRWSQAEFATLAGIPRSTLSAIESRRLTPSVTTALAVARVLGCRVEDLFADGTGRTHATEWAW
ncbi:MAG: helix-turn-helix transcriptional regulator, partial [Verrucomicrobiae bacterium]|nr:helix-turn-helix transcriptional regulator [Verrucomicrobiae bacterium]